MGYCLFLWVTGC